MVTCELPAYPSEEFMQLVPAQRDKMNNLLIEGVVKSYTLSANYRLLWVIINGTSEEDIISKLNTFPMIGYFKYYIMELVFNVSNSTVFPQFSMN